MLLFACNLDECLNERGLAKGKCTLTLQAISRQVLPWMVVATIDEFEHLPETAHAVELV